MAVCSTDPWLEMAASSSYYQYDLINMETKRVFSCRLIVLGGGQREVSEVAGDNGWQRVSGTCRCIVCGTGGGHSVKCRLVLTSSLPRTNERVVLAKLPLHPVTSPLHPAQLLWTKNKN